MINSPQDFVEKYINDIDANNWKKVYDMANIELDEVSVGFLTEMFLDSGIHPLLWMEDIPSNFLNQTMKIKSIFIPDSIYWIGNKAFYGSRLEDLDLSNTIVQGIGAEAFKDCNNLEKIIFSNKLMRIDVRAFANCYLLKEITLPKSIEVIQFNAFSNCDSLKSINYEGTSKQLIDKVLIANNAFYDCEAEYIKCADGKNIYLEDLK